jgi:hypothetical protein
MFVSVWEGDVIGCQLSANVPNNIWVALTSKECRNITGAYQLYGSRCLLLFVAPGFRTSVHQYLCFTASDLLYTFAPKKGLVLNPNFEMVDY